MKIFFALLGLAALAGADTYKPFEVISLSGEARLFRFEDEPWPLETGQRIPGDVHFVLEPGAFLHLRVENRLDFAALGPAEFRAYDIETHTDFKSTHETVFRIENGLYYSDTRFLFGKPTKAMIQWGGPARALEPLAQEFHAPQGVTVWPEAFVALSRAALPVLVLTRDYNIEVDRWLRPAVLGPALVTALKELPGLSLVDGSGTTTLGYYVSGALRKGEDAFLKQFAREKGARFVVAANLVLEMLRDESPRLMNNPLMAATAEMRVLEAFEGGEELVSDSASALAPRRGLPLIEAGLDAAQAAAERAGRNLRGDFEVLLQGQTHARTVLRATFTNANDARQRELRRGLSELLEVQRFFKRGFANGVLKLDLMLRKSEAEFIAALEGRAWNGFELEKDPSAAPGELLYTLRPVAPPTPVPTPTPKRPLDWRR